MNRPLRLAQVGVGGFGRVHEMAALRLQDQGLIEVAAFAEPSDANAENSLLAAQHVRRYASFDALLAAESRVDIVALATPIPYHYAQARKALERGLHLFLEKPPVVCIQHLRDLEAIRQRAGLQCAVGFHDMARPDAIRLKQRLCEGVLGKVMAVRAEARWRRTDAYYARNAWAGKLSLNGTWVLDGPMNNACAHVLNMTSFLAGTTPESFARPLSVQAELYRAADIEGEDTNCLRARMDSGVEVCIHLTQASDIPASRMWTVIGEKGTALLSDERGMIIQDEHMLPLLDASLTEALLRRLTLVLQGVEKDVLMPLAEAEGFLLLSNGAYESAGGIASVPPEFTARIPEDGSMATIIPGIAETIKTATQAGKLLSECGLSWTQATQPFNLAGYAAFPTRWGK